MEDKERIKDIKDDVKVLLGIQDSEQDGILNIIIKNVMKHLEMEIRRVNPNIKEIPYELDFIIEEVTILRFNRIGSEGMQSESVEGHSITFKDLKDDFIPYSLIIQDYKEDDNEDKGKVLFL